jgi:hypothetical protein
MFSPHRPSRLSPVAAVLITVLAGFASEASAQFASNIRLTNPIGRTVLELRKGTQPANPRLLFTAAITAGPTGGTTSLLLQQMPIADLFDPAVPAASWVTVRSSATAFSLGGGCGRGNLIDFPFINNSRPEILRISGTTQQVITPSIAGNDLYDSIDCMTQGDGRVLYMLTNRTRRTLEMRREQGGILVLVRDDFGTVITPFVGGIRPSLGRILRPTGVRMPGVDSTDHDSPAGDDDALSAAYVFAEASGFQIEVGRSAPVVYGIGDDDALTLRGNCFGPSRPIPTVFSYPKDTAIASGVAVGASRGDDLLWADFFAVAAGGCKQTQAAESFGPVGPFSQYTWTAVAANTQSRGVEIAYSTLVLPSGVITFERNQRQTQVSPFAGRGGPVTACPLVGPEIDAAQLVIGPGPTNLHVQHSVVTANLAETVSNSSFEPPSDTVPNCD